MADINFITENPATAAYKAESDQLYQDKSRALDLDTRKQDLAQKIARAPFELRGLGADTTSKESEARLKTGTEGFNIQKSQAEANKATTEADLAGQTEADKVAQQRNLTREGGVKADVAEATKGYEIKKSGSEASRAGSEASTAASNATVGRNTIQSRTDLSNSQAGLEAERLKQAKFKPNEDALNKELEYIEKGHPELALADAKARGLPLDPQLVTDAQFAANLRALAAEGARIYGTGASADRAGYDAYMKAGRKQIMEAHVQGRTLNPVEVLQVPGAPPPPAGGAQGGISAGDKRIIDLVKQRNTKLPTIPGLSSPVTDYAAVARMLAAPPPAGYGRPDLTPFAGAGPGTQPQPGMQPMLTGGQQQQAVPPPEQRTPNTVYQTPRGPLTWTGTGWR